MRSSLAVLALLLVPPAAGAQNDLDARLARAFATVEPVLARFNVPGFVIGVTDRDRTLELFTHGYADLKTKQPVTAETLFELGSVSKSFTAIALMRAYDEGRFDPQLPVSTYLPWFSVRSRFGPITSHHLLTHTAGIPRYRGDLSSMSYAAYALRDYELPYPPGEHYWYSNLGYQTLGYVLEAIEGQPYDTIITRRIFAPLHMTSSIAAITDDARPRLLASYDADYPDAPLVEQPWFEYRAADASIASTIGDMLAYARLFLNRGVGPEGRVLSERAFTLLTTPVGFYAYGVGIISDSGQFIVRHGGAIAGYRSDFLADVGDGFAIVALSNAPMPNEPMQWLAKTMMAAARGRPLPSAPAAETPAERLAAARALAGTYTASDGNTVRFVASERGLALDRGARLVPLVRLDRTSYLATEKDLAAFPFTFEQHDGATVAVSHGPDWYAAASYSGPRTFPTPAALLPLVGRYENHNPEGEPVRVFVRNGRLYVAEGIGEATELVRLGENLFRPAEPEFNPERYAFDTIVDGHALRLVWSGMPMYRVDDR